MLQPNHLSNKILPLEFLKEKKKTHRSFMNYPIFTGEYLILQSKSQLCCVFNSQHFPVLCVTTSPLCHSHGCKNSSLDPQYNLASSDLRGANGMELSLRDSIVQVHSSV